jgi:predicted DNA-binding protein with PD1-like motif
MIVTESRSGRRIVGRLDRGASLHDALLDVCQKRQVRTAELRAVGSFESVEVAEYDQARKLWKPSRTFAGGVEILNLSGNVSEKGGQLVLHAHAALMRERDNGVEVLGGHVVAARVFALEFVLDAFDDVLLRRGLDAATGLPLWTEALSADALAPAPAPAPVPVPTPPPKPTTWADVIRASEPKPEARGSRPVAAPEPEPEVEPEPEAEASPEPESAEGLEPGDVLLHPTFGRCEVQRIEGGYEFAHVRLRNGRLVRLSLDVLQIVPAGTEAGHRLFRARVND